MQLRTVTTKIKSNEKMESFLEKDVKLDINDYESWRLFEMKVEGYFMLKGRKSLFLYDEQDEPYPDSPTDFRMINSTAITSRAEPQKRALEAFEDFSVYLYNRLIHSLSDELNLEIAGMPARLKTGMCVWAKIRCMMLERNSAYFD